MTNEDKLHDDLNPTELQAQPAELPQLSAKPGFKTSQGQLTGLFTIICLVLAAFGYHSWTPEKMQNAFDMITTVSTTIGPVVALIPVLINYANSRGKIASNALWASASLSNGGMSPADQTLTPLHDVSTVPRIGNATAIGGELISGGLSDYVGQLVPPQPQEFLGLNKLIKKIGPTLDNAATVLAIGKALNVPYFDKAASIDEKVNMIINAVHSDKQE